MERKSKEHIISDITDIDEGIISAYDYSIYEAMQTYADQEMEAVINFIFNKFVDTMWLIDLKESHTPQQLLTIYKEQDGK